jgi:hypothetical protein
MGLWYLKLRDSEQGLVDETTLQVLRKGKHPLGQVGVVSLW